MKKVLVMILALALLSVGALAEGRLSVQGVGVVTVDANRATISLGVREYADDVRTAQNAVNDKLATVIAALEASGVEESAISTNSIGIYANYDYTDGEKVIGYTAYNSVILTVTDVDNVGAYIDTAFAAGANDLDYVQFFAVDTIEAGDQALALAVQAAQHKAQVLADAAGVELGELVEIRDEATSVYDVNDGFAKAENTDGDAGTTVLASQQQVSASVTLVYAVSGE